jgi:hypothetical protein
VDDFGAYWDKGVVDPALEGSWKRIDAPGEAPNTEVCGEGWNFRRTGSAYSMYTFNEPSNAASTSRTLRVGSRRLLMNRNRAPEPDGLITGYEIRNRTLSQYWFDNVAVVEFLEAKHPGAANIGKAPGEGQFVLIKRLDDEVFRILSEIARSPDYWILICQYRKTSN